MEHIEEAGIHSGDSACVLPPMTISGEIERLRASTEAIAREIGVRGLINIQFALAGSVLYVLEANPRASRTVPFVSKATAVPLAKAAARISLGATIADLRAEGLLRPRGDGGTLPLTAPISVKEAVLPWTRFRDALGPAAPTPALGPEMRSTGEVMGIDASLRHRLRQVAERRLRRAAHQGTGLHLGRRPLQAGHGLPGGGARRPRLHAARHRRHAPRCCAATASSATVVRKHRDGAGPNGEPTIVRLIHEGQVDLVVNTPYGAGGRMDGYEIRTAAVARGVPCLTTVQALAAAIQGIDALDLRRGGRALVAGARPPAQVTRRGRSSGEERASPARVVRARSSVGAGERRGRGGPRWGPGSCRRRRPPPG